MACVQIILAIALLGCLQNCLAQTVLPLALDNLLKMQQGVGWPHTLNVAEGHEALLKLDSNSINPASCTVTSPSGLHFNVNTPPNDRFESWSDGCGLRVRQVVKADEGRWRLNATKTDDYVAGWTELFVQEATTTDTAPPISLQDGQTHADVVLTSLNNSYCVVAQPYSDSSLVPGHCHVTLDKATRAVQGSWNVLLGLPGQVPELHVYRQVAVEAERLDVGYIHDTNANKLNLYCNILHSSKNITFCRFQKTTSSSGYNVMDGLGDGAHSYYGDGFLSRQCGMTIESPTNANYGTWRCSVGTQQWIGDKIEQAQPLQALISVAPSYSSHSRHQRSDSEEVPTVFVQGNQSFTVMCRAHLSLSYCWFQHPNGSQFTPVQIADEDQLFWYSGESLITGDCGITFSHATMEDAGDWKCHMGPKDQPGIETTDVVTVRVTGPLAANKKVVAAKVGEQVTLYCHTSNGNKPLEYCRFLSPKFVGLSLDSSVTKTNAILGRFYFTPERNLDYGDCSLTIDPVTAEDLGEWTCAALINEEPVESRDIITVSKVSGSRAQAGLVGMAVGLSVLGVILAGFLVYKRGLPGLAWLRRRSADGESTFAVRFSGSSTSSQNSDEITIDTAPRSRHENLSRSISTYM